jgi:16S rRNA (guanine(1405)-N(7))-methyltransferase
MSLHASTNERLPILDDFYGQILADVLPIRSVVDLACGLNPLAIPWMPLAEDASYTAYDIYGDMIDFVDEFMARIGVNGRAHLRDIITQPPTVEADLVLLLKSVPCLEQVEKTAVSRLLDHIQARHLLISFPARTLGGHNKGMVATYEARFEELVDGRNWSFQRFQFDTELAFLVDMNNE